MLRADDILYGLSVNDIARLCAVDLATARRWKRGTTCPPQSALMILAGDLGCFDQAWRGWKISQGKLVSPENWIATPGDVLSIQLYEMQISHFRAQNRVLKEELAAAEVATFEEQPMPESLSTDFKIK